MSTRATYEVDGYTFYIHHDGYPEGAAQYFKQALEFAEGRKGNMDYSPNAGFTEDFMRANTRAALTPSHEVHGDTEYQYTVSTEVNALGPYKFHIKAQTRKGDVFFMGQLEDFIEQYS